VATTSKIEFRRIVFPDGVSVSTGQMLRLSDGRQLELVVRAEPAAFATARPAPNIDEVPRDGTRIIFEYNDQNYSADYDEAYTQGLPLRLPDGRVLRAVGDWWETFPPSPRELELVTFADVTARTLGIV